VALTTTRGRECQVERKALHFTECLPNSLDMEGLKALPAPLTVQLNVHRGVVVPMQAGPAVRAGVPADGQTFRDDDAAPRTGLAREHGIDRPHSLPGARSLESEDGEERTPPRVADAFGEVVIPHHVGDPQILVIDRVVALDERQCRLVVEVLALATHRLMRLRQQADRLPPAMTPLLALGDAPLAFRQVPLGFAVVARREDARAISQRGEGFQAQVDAGLLAGGGSGRTGTSAQEIAMYQPSASFVTVTVLGVPSMGRDQWMAMRPIFERTREPLSSLAPLPYSLNVKEW
jgi:hypothetical protein